MKNRFFDNWLLKVGSLLCAIILWVVVFNITDPINTLKIYNVEVELLNTDLVTDNNQVYEILNSTDVIQSISVKAQTSVINDLKESDIVVEADFNKLTMDGTIELNAYTTRHSGDTEISLSNDTLQLNVENIMEKYLPLTLEVVGETAEGYVVNSKSINQNQVYVVGPESVLTSIDYVGAVVDLSGTRGDISTYAELVLYDTEGNEVSYDRVTMNTTQVLATIEVWATKEVPVTYVVEGEAQTGYEWTGAIETGYETIQIKGEEADLNGVYEIVVEDDLLTLDGAEENVVMQLDIDDYLPDGVVRNDSIQGGKFDMTLFVEEVVMQEEEARVTSITYKNVPTDYTVTAVDNTQYVTIRLSGIESNLIDDEKASFTLEVDISEYLEDDTLEEPLTLMVTPIVMIDDSIEAYSVDQVEVVIEPPTTE
ncbi:MAG: CdaR family protein [Lachnospiraceae bacterium]